ncbi:MAG: hypothetical protein A2Y10_08220 [Planctomycetes bacterium GWF2_41_51]|nr:MAG: hypothetical protein A2Y10_08220 [Planctomycetes bacterium GWF2_41_51]HBG26145.1 hypothetical protein [Phycisphaerales bacterium]
MLKKISIIALVLVFLTSLGFAGPGCGAHKKEAGSEVKAACCTCCEKCVCEECKCSETCCGEKSCKDGAECKCEKCKCKAEADTKHKH